MVLADMLLQEVAVVLEKLEILMAVHRVEMEQRLQ
jgi:hypothetical protein